MCVWHDMSCHTHSHVTHTSIFQDDESCHTHIHVWDMPRDICVTWLFVFKYRCVCVCVCVTWLLILKYGCVCVTWLCVCVTRLIISTPTLSVMSRKCYTMPHVAVACEKRRVLFVAWLIHKCVWHDAFACETWRVDVCGTWLDMLMCVWHVDVCVWHIDVCVTCCITEFDILMCVWYNDVCVWYIGVCVTCWCVCHMFMWVFDIMMCVWHVSSSSNTVENLMRRTCCSSTASLMHDTTHDTNSYVWLWSTVTQSQCLNPKP